ncbi:histidine triad nucleotide-binding protein 3-like isoform X7 [Syngnathus acus]|uniref:histidine triad nucleotide-binding protein 3-like isoform X7 n=1 Tax=Syngnathus acus TaxID=161584 RepID=UPI00188608F6|nr:histidine triad nucleotide-binding protein 3-like isoform X7 [Syngnathus acus]
MRMGFHHPPYTSVDHLHLHVLAPASMIKEVLMVKFRPGSLAFIEDEELLCFRDVKPGAGHHYLVITRRHICNCKALRAQHIPTVERMAEMGKCALEKNKVRDLKDIRLGFHVPPFSSVPHLHLHALAPASKMNESSQRRYGPQSHWFISRLAGRGNAVAAQDTRQNQMKSSVE